MSEKLRVPAASAPEAPKGKEKLSREENKQLLRAVVIETTRLTEAQARDIADHRMTESKEDRSQGFFKRTITRIWKHNLFQEYYRQKEIVTARRDIVENENLYAGEEGAGEAQHQAAMDAIIDRFTSEYEDETLKTEERESKRTVEGGDANDQIKALIREYAGNQEMSKDAFDEERGRILAMIDPAYRTGAATYADNFFELATQARRAIEHGTKLEQLEFDVSLTLGKARESLNTEAKMTGFDRIMEKAKGHPLGSFLTNGSAISIAAGAYAFMKAAGVGVLKSNVTQAATFGAGVAVAGALSGYNEATRLKRDRAQHMRESAKGMKFEEGSKRREEMGENAYVSVQARDITASLNAQLDKVRAGTLSHEELSQTTIGTLAELETRIALGDERKADLIAYSRFDQVEQERAALLIARAKMKAELRKGDPDFETKLADLVGDRRVWLTRGEEGMDQKDRVFSKMRNKKVAGAVVRTVLVGAAAGVVFQEAAAAFNSNQDGLLEGTWKTFTGSDANVDKGATLLEGARRLIPGEGPRMPAGEIHTVMVGSTAVELPQGADLVENPDGTYDLTRGGDIITDNVKLEFGPDGNLTEASRTLLGGMDVGSTFSVTEGETLSSAEYVNQHEELTQQVRRGLWYDNDTPKPVFDKNELRQWWGGENNTGIDTEGNYVFSVDRMTAEGSFHGAESVNAEAHREAGTLKLLLSLSRDTQHQVFEVAIDANGNAIIPPDSEIAQLMFREVDGKAVFVGQYAEVAESMGIAEDGAEQVRILSTVVGEGRDMIETPPVGHVLLDVPDSSDVELPPFLPLPLARRPLERGAYPPPFKMPPFVGSPGYYGYGGFATPEGIWSEMERANVSLDTYFERLEDGKRIWVDKEGNPVKRDVRREKARMQAYLEAQDPGYRAELDAFATEVGPMDERCRVAVIIPARFEEKNLENLLNQYSQQVGPDGMLVDPATFEINILVNRKEGETPDDSMGIISRWKEANPRYRVNTIDITFSPEKANVGTARKYITDLVLARAANRSESAGPLYIESEDADLVSVDRRTVSRLTSSFDAKPHLDVLRGIQDRQPEIMMKNDLFFFERRMSDMTETFMRREAYRPENMKRSNFVWNRVVSGGWNTAFTAESYAQIGGYVSDVVGEDMKIGQKISLLRGKRSDTGEIAPNTLTAETSGLRANSSPRRYLDAMNRRRGPYDDFEDQSLKHKTIEEMLDGIKEYATATESQKEIYEDLINRNVAFLKEQLTAPAAKEVTSRVLWGMGLRRGVDYTYREDGHISLTDEAMPNVMRLLSKYKEDKRYLWGYKRQGNTVDGSKPRVFVKAGSAPSPSKKPRFTVKAGSAPTPPDVRVT